MGWSQDYLALDTLTGDSTVSVSGMLWFHTVQYKHESCTHMHQLNTCGLGRSALASSSCVCVEETLFHSFLIILYHIVHPLYLSFSACSLKQSVHSVESMHNKRAQYNNNS